MTGLALVPRSEFDRVRLADVPRDDRLALLADMARANALTAVKRAGSGHLGSSFSAMDIVTFLFEEELTTAQLGWDHPDRDIYFSSKGHDVPGLYAALHSFGVIPPERLLRLRRAGWARRASGRPRARHRGQLGLARHGDLQGPRHGLGQDDSSAAAGAWS